MRSAMGAVLLLLIARFHHQHGSSRRLRTRGLIHYVESGQLIVPWKEHEDFLRERKCSVLSRPW
jgi:hypothetical protein